MPFADRSPVRLARQRLRMTLSELAVATGLSASTLGVIERLRNPDWVRELKRRNLKTSKTTIEVATRICAYFGYLEYNQGYSPEEIEEAGKLFAADQLSERPARCAKPYPEEFRSTPKAILRLVKAA